MPSARAAGKVSLSIAEMEIPGGRAAGIELVLQPEAATAEVTAEHLAMEELAFSDVQLECDAFRLNDQAMGCRGRVELVSQEWGVIAAEVIFDYSFETGLMEIAGNTDHFGGTIQFDAQVGEALSIDFSVQGLALADVLGESVEGFNFHGGTMSGAGRVEQDDGEPMKLTGRFRVEALGFDNADGTIAAADLVATASGTLTLGDEETGFDIELAPESGELLVQSLYLNLSEAAPRLALAGSLGEERLSVSSGRLQDGDILDIALTGALPLGESEDIGRWEVDLNTVRMPGAFDRYLSNFTEAAGFGKLSSAGALSGRVELHNTTVENARLRMNTLSLADERGRIAVTDLNGQVHYRDEGESELSRLTWRSAAIYEVLLGDAVAEFRVAGDRFELLSPLRMGVFDGALAINTLSFTELGDTDMTLDFEALVEPISLRPITDALDWPTMNGTLSGRIPRVTLRDEVVEVGGAIRLEVFDGLVVAEKLRLERIFGVLPTFAGDVTLTNLDLQQMTGAFSFGEIQGRLGGWIKGLRLLDWEPVAFDLDLHTPPDDDSRHRISQRAVDNLSSIGGGPTGILSSGFLRFFDDFRYDRLGLSCRLQNNVCRMGGVGAAPNGGYYIVKGSGIPRIDVIGFSREVDFPQLINRLQAATASGAPTID